MEHGKPRWFDSWPLQLQARLNRGKKLTPRQLMVVAAETNARIGRTLRQQENCDSNTIKMVILGLSDGAGVTSMLATVPGRGDASYSPIRHIHADCGDPATSVAVVGTPAIEELTVYQPVLDGYTPRIVFTEEEMTKTHIVCPRWEVMPSSSYE